MRNGAQTELIVRHVDWCREQLESDRRTLDLYISGQMTLRRNGSDVSSDEIQRLGRSIKHLEEHLATLE